MHDKLKIGRLFLGLFIFLRRPLPGDPVPFARPSAKVYHLTALGAKRTKRVLGPEHGFLTAMRTFNPDFAHLLPPANKYLQLEKGLEEGCINRDVSVSQRSYSGELVFSFIEL